MEWPKACSLFTEQEPQQGPQEPQQGPQEPQLGPQEPQQGPQEPQQGLQESLQERLRRKKKMTLHYCMLSESALLQIVCKTS